MDNWFFKKNLLIDQLVAPNVNKISIVDKEYILLNLIPSFSSLNKGLSINLKPFLLEQSPASADQDP